MLQLISAFVATSYIFSVLILAFLTLCAFDKPVTRELFAYSLRKYLGYIEVSASSVTEMALHLVLFKILNIAVVNLFGGFNYTFSKFTYYIDIANMFALGYLFYEMVIEKQVAETAIQSMDTAKKPLKSCWTEWNKLLNPIWTPENIKLHPNITYATNEEIRDALNTTNQDFDQPRKMMLDVYTSMMPTSGLQPVLVHIHGGAWQKGDKGIFYPHEKILIEENNWVIVNVGYRLAPKNAYPTHLKDVKRAIRWIKQNISSFGGDPNFIVLSGDSSGAHLAAMTSITNNDAQYQPGFENVDTSVRGVVSISGALDMASETHNAVFFCKKVARLGKVDVEFLSQHSPLAMLRRAKDENKLVPFLLIAGERDALTESKMSKEFKCAYDDAMGGPSTLCTIVLFPTGHHVNYITWSPRCLYTARVIQSWCEQLYTKNK